MASAGNEELAHYRNALHYGDQALGVLLDGLRARNLDRNTLFVIFGDHGEAFGQHEGNFGHTLFIYDENVHVPYLVVAPGLIREQIRVREGMSLIDTEPSILDLLGLPIPAGLLGTSMLDPAPRMSLFFTDYSLGWLGLYDDCRKYLFQINAAQSLLYDLCMDPDETMDLSSRQPERASAYRSLLERWITSLK
jgi:lipoteichoic acid synthase